MLIELLHQRIQSLEQEYKRGEEELWRVQKRATYLAGVLERLQGGMLAIHEVLRQAQQAPTSSNGALPMLETTLP